MEEKTRKGVSSRMRNYVVGCVQDVVGKNEKSGSIQRRTEERDECFLTSISIFEIGGGSRGR